MCGIAGIWLNRNADLGCITDIFRRMLARLNHRGPDDGGLWIDRENGLLFGHRRLAILDLSPGGRQPMLSDDHKISLVFNGEIYNYKELRRLLEADGYVFRSSSDSEVLLRGYERWGVEVLQRIVGMFSFAIWDSSKHELFLARDRAGEKPMYYSHTPMGFVFASELAALTLFPSINQSYDLDAIALFLTYRYVPCPKSIYEGVNKLQPAHAMRVTAGKAKIWRYWDPIPLVSAPRLVLTKEEALEELEALLLQAVRGQLLSDVPLGAFLSGGLDSSAIVSLMTEVSTTPVKTFTIGFEEKRFDESSHAQKVAQHLGTDHTVEFLTERNVMDLITQLPEIYGEPFADASALPTHLLAKIARKYVTVALTGDGGDEVFGGYDRFGRLPWIAFVARALSPVAGPIRRMLGPTTGLSVRALEKLGKSPSEVYRRMVPGYDPGQIELWLGRLPEYPEYDRVWQMLDNVPVRRKAMVSDLLTYLPDDILVKVDRAAMATSLETRAPILDHRVLEFALQLPMGFLKDKSILKALAFRRVPPSLLDRPKAGFVIPLGPWFRGELRSMLTDLVTPTEMIKFGIDNFEPIARLLAEHLRGRRDHASILWTLLSLSLWNQKIKNNITEESVPAQMVTRNRCLESANG